MKATRLRAKDNPKKQSKKHRHYRGWRLDLLDEGELWADVLLDEINEKQNLQKSIEIEQPAVDDDFDAWLSWVLDHKITPRVPH